MAVLVRAFPKITRVNLARKNGESDNTRPKGNGRQPSAGRGQSDDPSFKADHLGGFSARVAGSFRFASGAGVGGMGNRSAGN